MEAVFVEGKPLKITRDDFRRHFLDRFPKLVDAKTDDLIDEAIEAVYDMYTGINTLWDMQTAQVWFDKTRRCFLFLTAWYIADMYPRYVSGVPTMGGLPIKEKSIGGIKLKFDGSDTMSNNSNYLDMLKGLLSNPFGKQAYMMITTSAKRTALR